MPLVSCHVPCELTWNGIARTLKSFIVRHSFLVTISRHSTTQFVPLYHREIPSTAVFVSDSSLSSSITLVAGIDRLLQPVTPRRSSRVCMLQASPGDRELLAVDNTRVYCFGDKSWRSSSLGIWMHSLPTQTLFALYLLAAPVS